MDLPIKISHGYCIDYEFHAIPLDEPAVIRNHQYAIDLRVEVDCPVKPHIVSLDEKKLQFQKWNCFQGFSLILL